MKITKNMIRKGKRFCGVMMDWMKYAVGRKPEFLILITPDHGNLGDHAIIEAELRWIREKAKEGSVKEISREQIWKIPWLYAAVTPEKCKVFIQGGGFLGSLWPLGEESFRSCLRAFSKHRLVIFPQTVFFDLSTEKGRDYLRQSQKIYSAHPNMVLFVREEKSYVFVKEHFPRLDVRLVPDMVTLLEMNIKVESRNGILLCMRCDREKTRTDDTDTRLLAALEERFPKEACQWTDTVLDHPVSKKMRRMEVRKKMVEFASAKMVITDRLHGMLFSAVTSTPCIAIDNASSKVGGVYHWIKELPYIHYVKDVDELELRIQQIIVDQEYHYNRELVKGRFTALEEAMREQ